MKILITGSAGFIGYHVTKKLFLNKNVTVVGIDNLNDYYEVKLKKDRLKDLRKINSKFKFYKEDIINLKKLDSLFKKYKFNVVINLAAQVGVRYSIKYPEKYFQSNMLGFYNILELSRKYKIKHLIFASSSSVYGNNKKYPWNENMITDNPLSFYASTKKSNELMAYSYNNIYKLRCTGLRFFTVYGEWGRPDMAVFKFTKSILEKKTINLYNYGKNIRDFTYIEDVVNSVLILLKKPLNNNKNSFAIYNIGNGKPLKVIKIIKLLEKNLKIKAKIKYVEAISGDAIKTYADTNKLILNTKVKFKKNTDKCIKNFVNWYKQYYKINKLN